MYSVTGSGVITDHEGGRSGVLEVDYITRGLTVEAFEQPVADIVGVEYAVATPSSTTALYFTGGATDFKSGTEITMTPLTFASTTHVATYSGVGPVFVDIDHNGERWIRNGRHSLDRKRFRIVALIADADDYHLSLSVCHMKGSPRKI